MANQRFESESLSDIYQFIELEKVLHFNLLDVE